MKYSIIKKWNKSYVVVEMKRNYSKFPQPNFMDSGLALVGVLKENQTLQQFIANRKTVYMIAEKRVDKAIREFRNNNVKKNDKILA